MEKRKVIGLEGRVTPEQFAAFESKLTSIERRLVAIERTGDEAAYNTHFAQTYITESKNKISKSWSLHEM